MTLRCFKCASDVNGNFCSNCGALINVNYHLQYLKKGGAKSKSQWTDKCPICKSGKLLPSQKKHFFNLKTTNAFDCENCGTVFTKKGRGYKIEKGPSSYQEYRDEVLTEREWKNIAYGGMSDARQKDADMEKWLTLLKKGDLSIRMDGNPQQLFKKNEELVFNLSNISLIEPRTIKSEYMVPVFKMAQGVYFRVGNFQPHTNKELRTIDQGELTLTNYRLLFSGKEKTSKIDLKKIVSIEPYSNGIGLKISGSDTMQYFTNIDQIWLTIEVGDRVYRKKLTGLIFMYTVEGLLTKMQ